MNTYNDQEHAEQGKIQNVQEEEKKSTRRRDKSSAQRDKMSKEKPDTRRNKRSGDLRARPLPNKLPTCKKKLKKV